MSKEHQGLQYAKPARAAAMLTETPQDLLPASETPNLKSCNICCTLLNPQNIAIGHMDLIGRFLKQSSRGNKHILVGYHFDVNFVKGVLLKSRRGEVITEA